MNATTGMVCPIHGPHTGQPGCVYCAPQASNLVARLRDGALVSKRSASRHAGDVGEMFAAMAEIFTESANEIEQLYRERDFARTERDRACQETRETMARETGALRAAAQANGGTDPFDSAFFAGAFAASPSSSSKRVSDHDLHGYLDEYEPGSTLHRLLTELLGLRALTDKPAVETGDDWQPIATAPSKGGFMVALDGLPHLAWPAHADDGHIYSNAHGILNELDYSHRVTRATHWRPLLPPAPQVKTGCSES